MEEEKMAVLRMLEEGKITAEEAAILLDALEGRNKVNFQKESKFSLLDKFKESVTVLPNLPEEIIEEKLDKVEQKIEGMKKIDFGNSIADGILDFIFKGKEEKLEKEFEFKDIEENVSLRIMVANGDVVLKSWDNDYIRVKAEYTVRSGGRGLDVKYEGNCLNIVSDRTLKKAEIEVCLPDVRCEEVKLESVNGDISAENLNMKKVNIKNVNSDVNLKHVYLEEANISTVNGDISIYNIKMNLPKAFVKIDTINGDVKVRLEDENLGVNYKLKTITGDCSVNLPGVSQTIKNKHYLKGSTKNFKEAEKKVEIQINSINGDITLE
ncbi:DUF4097 family beta strand repeat-containing protein [Caldanaerobacter sp.]|uniref:DUF4097 family beta strand repeat-containing protein n=1 Tax=Caldanaerobacter sp. TaxID=2930036 RepID=UPI003C764B23